MPIAKGLLIVMLMHIMTVASFARIWTVDNDVSNNPDFTSIGNAANAAAAGDTIYVAGSLQDYGTIPLSKRLTILGPGYFLNENPETQDFFVSAKLVSLAFIGGAQGAMVSGMEILNGIDINVDSIVLRRNYVHTAGNVVTISAGTQDVVITQNYLFNSVATGDLVYVASDCHHITITNNIMIRNGGTYYGIRCTSSGSADIRNNFLLNAESYVYNSIFYNNIQNGSTITFTNCDIRHNIGSGSWFGTSNGNQSNVDMNTVFVGAGSTDGRWMLKNGSPAIGAGIDGRDCGPFGGIAPYVLSGLPPIPAIYFLLAPTVGSDGQGLPVNIKIKSHN